MRSLESYKMLLNRRLDFAKHLFKWCLISIILGILTGIICSLFLESLEFVTIMRNKNPYLLYFLPFSGLLIAFIYKNYAGSVYRGVNIILDRVHIGEESVPLKMIPIVFFGAVTTHLFGGSAGREGVGVQIGGSLSEALSKVFKLGKNDRKILIISGISSGFSSIFGTPIAGTIFGLEVLSSGGMNYEALIPALTASITGSCVSNLMGIHHSHLKLGIIPDISLIIIIKVIAAAIIFGLVGRLFYKSLHNLKGILNKYLPNPYIKIFLGGTMIICLTLIIGTREYSGLSLPLLQEAFNSPVNKLSFMWKLIFTVVTLAVGFQGGEVTPLFVIGATLGNLLAPILHLPIAMMAALGYISVFCGATNAPVACFIMAIELFGSEAALFMFLSCAVSYIFSGHGSIYTSQKILIKKFK